MVVGPSYRRSYNSRTSDNSRTRKMIAPHPSHHSWQQQYARSLNYPRMQVDLQRNIGTVATNPYLHSGSTAGRRTNEVMSGMRQPFTNTSFTYKSADPKQPKFHQLYKEFENMKRKGLVMTSQMIPNNVNFANANRFCGSPNCEKQPETDSDDNFANAMKLFMKSYLPMSTLSCAKPVEDWSKEAGNLLQELTDNESQSDLDNSIWKIPNSSSDYKSESRTVCENGSFTKSSGSEAPNLSKGRKRLTSSNFDIHRHILEINPSPYPGGSPVSTGQSASNHSSDNDADDEDTKSLNDCSKAIGVKKTCKKKLNTSFVSMKDAGYLSSATETDGSRVSQNNAKVTGVLDSDDLSSESGFTSSTCSRPASPLSFTSLNWHDNPQGIGKRRHSLPEHSLSVAPQQQIAFCEFPKNTNMNGMTAAPLPKATGVYPPLPPPPLPPHIPPFISRLPLPPPPCFLPAPFHTPASPMQSPISGMLTRPISPFTVIHNMSNSHPYQKDIIPAQNLIATGSNAAFDSFGHTDAGIYHKHKAWITDEILEMIAVRDRLYKRMKKHPAPDIVEMYKKVRNMVVGMTRNAKRAYEKQIEDQQMVNHRNDKHTESTQVGDEVRLNFMQASW